MAGVLSMFLIYMLLQWFYALFFFFWREFLMLAEPSAQTRLALKKGGRCGLGESIATRGSDGFGLEHQGRIGVSTT